MIGYQAAADEIFGAGKLAIDEALIASIGDAAKGKFELSVDSAIARVNKHAPDAPENVRSLAVILMLGYLRDCPPNDRAAAFRLSGAQSALTPYRKHRAGIVGREVETPMPAAVGEMMRKA